ncbi:MAG: TonB-dependent receptor [Bacteroidota bacterium]
MKLKNLFVKIGLCCSFLLLLAFIPKVDDPIDKLIASLQKWTDANPQEKVYLHMDKPYYALGDTVWFKAYVTVGSKHQLSALSGSLYVDLITEQDSLVKSLKLPVITGMAVGDFELGDDLRPGSYRIRAYTKWMRNAGEDYFFDHTFTVGEIANDNIITKVDYQYKDVGNKPVLAATLNYTDDAGKAIADKDVRYMIFINKENVLSRNTKTDAQGHLLINIENDKHVNLSGAYIRTIIEGPNKQAVIRDFPIQASLVQSDVQFFPESGNLVNGLSSHVGFKAVGIDGRGINITGKIVDETNNEVADIETTHAGMGSFLLKPQTGKTYTANVSFADGSTKKITLPKAVDEGYVLSVFQPNKDSVLVRIGASANQVGQSVSFIAQSGGDVIFASPIKIAKATTSIWLEKKSFPTGITQFTIFNNVGDPLNERIAFIRGNDIMKLGIKSDKATYKKKEPITISLNAKDGKGAGTGGTFSMSVIDETKVPMDESAESTIFSNILLTSDLKGYIEKPNYYFTAETEDIDKAVDNLMLTQGYRRFTWKQVTNTVVTKPVFDAETGLGFKISGQVMTLGKKPSPNAVVNLISIKAQITKSVTADADGRFKFDGILLMDSIHFAVIAKSAKNSDNVKIVLDTLPKLRIGINRNLSDVSTNINNTLKTYIENGKKLDDFYEKSGQLDKVQRLKEVRIGARRNRQNAGITPQGMFQVPEVSADKVINVDPDEAGRYITLASYLQGRLQGISIEPDQNGMTQLINMRDRSTPVDLIIDGRKMITADAVSDMLDGSILPEDVAKIEVVKTNQAMVNFLGRPAVLILTRLGYTRKQYNPNVVNIAPKGFNKVREFYSPKYDKPGDADLPDLRTTIYWDPRVKTDASGNSTISFYNADGPGSYKVVVEGINAAGELGRQVYRYTVN